MTDNLWLVVLLCGAATFFWRALGVVFAERIDPSGDLFEWVSCVSYAMVAGLVCRMIIFPGNDLADIQLWIRATALAAGFGVYFLFRGSLILGVASGVTTLSVLIHFF